MIISNNIYIKQTNISTSNTTSQNFTEIIKQKLNRKVPNYL